MRCKVIVMVGLSVVMITAQCCTVKTTERNVRPRYNEPIEYSPPHTRQETGCKTPLVELKPKGDLSKTYMDYRSIKNTSSEQWRLLQTMDICDDGFIRDSDGYVAVALGSYFGDIGSRWIFYLDGGKILPVVKVDQKQDKHTCKDNIYGLDNWDIIEFIVDSSKMPKFPNGYVYGGNFNNNPDVSGEVMGWVEVESERDT